MEQDHLTPILLEYECHKEREKISDMTQKISLKTVKISLSAVTIEKTQYKGFSKSLNFYWVIWENCLEKNIIKMCRTLVYNYIHRN